MPQVIVHFKFWIFCFTSPFITVFLREKEKSENGPPTWHVTNFCWNTNIFQRLSPFRICPQWPTKLIYLNRKIFENRSREILIVYGQTQKTWTPEKFQESWLCSDQSQLISGQANKPQDHKIITVAMLVFSVTPFKVDQNKNENHSTYEVQSLGNERR